MREMCSRIIASLLGVLCFTVTSCHHLHEDPQPCATGLQLRIQYGNEPETCHCLTLLIYDADGSPILRRNYGHDLLIDLELAPATYHLVAWGGLSCDEASFSFSSDPASTPMRDLEVRLNADQTDRPLHHLFHGSLDFTVPYSTAPIEKTLYLKRDTNDLRIMLANVNGEPTDEADYDFSIITDNSRLDWNNELLTAGETIYIPWTRGNNMFGVTDSGFTSVMAYAEMSIPRLVWGNTATLLITRRSDGKEVIKVPLLNLLINYKSDRWGSMGTQEFFDRTNYWPITFFLTGDDDWVMTR